MNSKHYQPPRMRVSELQENQMLCESLDGSVQSNEWSRGSDSMMGFGDDDDDEYE